MSRHLVVLQNLVIILQVFLLLFCFVDLSGVPEWLSNTGKFHPVVLHFPIALTLLLIPTSFFIKKDDNNTQLKNFFSQLLHYNSLLATLTALAGFLLSAKGGYEKENLSVHQWLGASIAFISHALIYINRLNLKPIYFNGLLIACGMITVIGSHYGGELTHGEDFLSFKKETKNIVSYPPITSKTTVLQAAVQPIINAKCISCHNDQKSKGGLNMKDINAMLKGGKTGALWAAGDPEKSLMIQRMLLDLDDKNHMPPKGKTQLSSVEISIFKEWIKSGASPKLKYHDLANQDTLRILINKLIESLPKVASLKEYQFKAAESKTIEKLNNPFRHVYAFANNSPALIVEFFLKEKYTPSSLQELKEISNQIIQLSLAGMPAGDESFDIISNFSHLEKLNLNATSITGKRIEKLISCKQLEQISIANTQLGYDEAVKLASIPSLKKVFVWKTKIKEEEIESLKKKFSRIQWDFGFVANKNEILKLTAPIPVDVEKQIFGPEDLIAYKHPMPGVQIRYTTDGSNPDSATSKLYTGPFPATGLMRVRAIAVSQGWLTSDTTDNSYFQRGMQPDSAYLFYEPDPKYKAMGAKSLTDEVKGNASNLGINLLGYRDAHFKSGFYFKEATAFKEIIMSTVEYIDQYVFPPKQIILRGGDSPKKLKVISTLTPDQPSKNRSRHIIPFHLKADGKKYKYIEIEAIPVNKLPNWHPGRGDKGWVFVDEVFFY